MRVLRVLGQLVLWVGLAGCASVPKPVEAKAPSPLPDGRSPEPLQLAAAGPVDPVQPASPDADPKGAGEIAANWDCNGEIEPPPEGRWVTQIASVEASKANPEGAAYAEAARLFVDNKCLGMTGACKALHRHLLQWKSGRSERVVCAMVVMRYEKYQDWVDQTSPKRLEADLKKAVAQLGLKEGVSVGVTPLEDLGAPGGPRARWLWERLRNALGKHGAGIVQIKPAWNGMGVPRNMKLLVKGVLSERRQQGIDVVELNLAGLWRRRGKSPRYAPADPVVFARSIAPRTERVGPALPGGQTGDAPIAIRLKTKEDGSLCAGERTEIRMESGARYHVRVVNLYGKSGALVIWPPDGNSGVLEANQLTSLGGQFEAVPVKGSDAERFLVLASRTSAGLGRYAKLKAFCRIKGDDADNLHALRVPAGIELAATGYRLVTEGCPPPPDREGVAMALENVPFCQ